MLTDIKLSKAQIFKVIFKGGFLGSFLRKLAGPLMKVAVPLGKNILTPLGITAAASPINAGIQKKIHGLGKTTLIISNEEMNDIKKIVQALEDSDMKGKESLKQLKMKHKSKTKVFLGLLVGTLGASLLGNILARKGVVRAGSRNKKGKGIVRAGYGNEMDF